MMNPMHTVFVIDQDAGVRRFVRRVASSLDCRIESYAAAEEFLAEWWSESDGCAGGRLAALPLPACVVLELELPGMDGLQLQECLLKRHCDIPLIFATAAGEVWAAVLATKRGAQDFLEKPLEPVSLIRAIRHAWADGQRRHEQRARSRETLRRLSTLTRRERQVLDRLLRGEGVKRIAAGLGTSPHTVRNQRASILRKMGAQDDAQLVAMVLLSQ